MEFVFFCFFNPGCDIAGLSHVEPAADTFREGEKWIGVQINNGIVIDGRKLEFLEQNLPQCYPTRANVDLGGVIRLGYMARS
jgi:hypothetical protein